MNTKQLTAATLTGLLMMSGYVFADEAKSVASAPVVDAAMKPVELGNKICPVSGEKVGEMGDIVKQEYKGKIYNFCCSGCLKDFKKNPDKFAKIAEEALAKEATK